MTFHVGQKVVCVNDDWGIENMYWIQHMPNKPKRGRIYTVRDIRASRFDDGFGIRLHELVNPLTDWGADCRSLEGLFRVERFRPVVERKTDISVFEAMLTGASNELERADG